ncbi:class I SAM-dependent methyltransferase [Streptomyces sp. NPDC002773]|uniref:class I SAM-dependent methyltransferase n=1 Tax=Streptomyces sp. NPDC002773 TaxID=3154430 RepID=UPI00331FCCC1
MVHSRESKTPGTFPGGGGADWWDGFYADRDKPVPFFVAKPDENLVSYVEQGLLPAGGRAPDLGCGPGRNSLYLASLGYDVDAVDLSPTAVRWAEERAREAGVTNIRFTCGDAFRGAAPDGPYDLVYDSGCFHHLPPHRRRLPRLRGVLPLDGPLPPGMTRRQALTWPSGAPPAGRTVPSPPPPSPPPAPGP